MAPLLNSRTASMIDKQLDIFRLSLHEIPLDGTFDISFEFNTSKCDNHTISFHDLEVKVWWFGKDNITLAEMRLSPFTQRINSVTEVEAILKVVDGFSNNNYVAKRISDEFNLVFPCPKLHRKFVIV
ncbi:hypothetical protein P8452_07731 [Trifolium repens]|nr:hypothetical protein P8452_07731 [Trifolium repens]